MNERVCAIILDYFGADITKQSLFSLVGQGLKTIYVLDNSGAKDASAKLNNAIAEFASGDPGFDIKVLTTGKNLGFGRGVNYVLAHDMRSDSPHDYYLLLNNDAIARSGLITNMVAEFHKDPSITLVAPRIVSNDPKREFGIWYHRYFGLLLSQAGLGRFHYFTGCCLLFRRDLITASGIFDESFFMYGEDVELGWRLTRQGKKMICAKDVYVEHEYGPSVERSTFFYEYHMARGHLLLSWKTWMHPVEIPFLVLFKLIGLAGRAAARCCRYRTLTPIFSLFVAWIPLRVDKT
jgi:N-acetylglucosaminyl-diphospho-decaprenol L-rhamnosyltransferase